MWGYGFFVPTSRLHQPSTCKNHHHRQSSSRRESCTWYRYRYYLVPVRPTLTHTHRRSGAAAGSREHFDSNDSMQHGAFDDDIHSMNINLSSSKTFTLCVKTVMISNQEVRRKIIMHSLILIPRTIIQRNSITMIDDSSFIQPLAVVATSRETQKAEVLSFLHNFSHWGVVVMHDGGL